MRAAPASAPPPAVPDRFDAPPANTTTSVDISRWWTAWQDPALDALVEQALAANPGLREARARVAHLLDLVHARDGARGADIVQIVLGQGLLEPGPANFAEQRIGAQGRRPDVPVMIAHSVTDDVIPYRTGRDLGRRWCAEGARVRFDPLLTPTHVGGHVAALPRMGAFLDATLADRWTADSCGWF